MVELMGALCAGIIVGAGAAWRAWVLPAQERHAVLRHDLAEATELARDIHECIKRGRAAKDHGLIGNLECIYDHVAPKPESW